MSRLVREKDWSQTPLGPIERWPQTLRTLVESLLHAPFPMALWWGPGMSMIYNDGYAALLGRKHPDALGRSSRDVWAEAWPKVAPLAEAVFRRGESVSRERDHFVLERFGGPEDAWFTWSYSPVADGSGGVAGLLNIAVEDTERVRAEAARREGEARLRALAAASGAVLYRMSADWSELLPLDGKGLIASNDRPIRDWMERNVPASEHAALRERVRQCIASKAPFEMEHRVYRPDRSVGWTRSRAVPVLDGSGAVVEWVGTAEDVTERQQSVAALAETRRKLDSALIAGEVGTFEWDIANDRLWGDQNFERIFGIKLDASGAAPLATYVAALHPADRDHVLERIARSVETGCDYEAEYRVTSTVPPRWVVARGKVERDADGRAVRFPGVVLDETERKQAELLLAAQNRALELVASGAELSEALGALTRVVEEQSDGRAVAAILLVDDDGKTLRTGAAPGLPDEYCRAIDGIKAKAGLGTCADAASRDEVVVTPDIAAAASWRGLSHLPLALGLRSAWSMPIRAADGRVLGTFGTYFRECREPTVRERQIVEGLSRVAALAIERRRAEGDAQRLAAMIRSSRDAIMSVGLDGAVQTWNAGAERMFGYRADEIVGKPISVLAPPGNPEEPLRLLEKVRRGEPVVGVEAVRVRQDGSPVSVSINIDPVTDASGRVTAFAGVVRDITDRKRAEAALHESERRFRTMADGLPLIVWGHGPDGQQEFVNRTFCEFFGVSEEEMRGGRWRLLMHPDDGDAYRDEFVACLRDRRPFHAEVRVRRADGQWRWIESWGRPRFDDSGEFLGFIGTSADVTERKQGEVALRQSEGRFRELADAMPQMVWVTRPDGYHEYFNRRWYEFTGVPEGSTDGEGWNGLFHPEDQPEAWERWRRSLATGEPYEIEYRLRHRSGEYRWTLGRALPVRGDDGGIERWFGTCTDIDAMKRLTAEREHLLEREREARAEAEAANRAKDKFLAVLSHELRTPLSPVVMTIPALEIDPEMPFKFREDLAMVRRNIDLEVKLIDDLLDLSRVASGKLRLQMQPVHAHELLLHVLRSSVSETSGKRLSVRDELNASDDRLTADPARLQQVVWNLLRNSVKFTPDGGAITLRTRNDDDGHLLVEVEDTGVGIEPDVLPRIFDAFEQGDARLTRQFGGLGLGLAIAKAVVEMHGGTITAASGGRGRGATFTVRLATVTDDATTQPRTRGSEGNRKRGVGRPKVLLVEDHPDTARTLARLLQASSYEVKTAHSVASALQLAAAEQFDIVVSDIGLPDGTGYELMERISDRHGTKGIALSGYGMEEDMRKSREAGFVDHVVKPVNVDQLEAVIGRALGGGRQSPS